MKIEECLASATDTQTLIIENGAVAKVPRIVGDAFPCTAAFVVSDGNTYRAAGEAVYRALRDAGIDTAEPYIFPAEPPLHAKAEYADRLAEEMEARALKTRMHCLPIAVGAGTLNDLVKRAAHVYGTPYVCVPTGASVDGYTSYGAALLEKGFKKTFECAAPAAVVADTDILSSAPPFLASSGFGDLAGKTIAGTDWIIAEAAGAAGARGWEPIDGRAWAMTQTGLRDALAASEAAADGDADAVKTLFSALAVTGFSMQYLKSSRPVSGCEHLFSHIWEMGDLSVGGVPVTHGHKVAVGTLAAAALTELLFSDPRPPRPVRSAGVPTLGEREAEVRAAFSGMGAAEGAVATSTAKFLPPAELAVLREKLSDGWTGLRERVLERLVPYGELSEMLRRAGCPIKAETIGLGRSEAIRTGIKAQMIRNRYTVLDLAWDFGILDDLLARIEADSRYL